MENTENRRVFTVREEMDEVDVRLRRLASMMDALAVAYGTGEISDGTMTSEILLGLRGQTEDIRAKLDDALQALLRTAIA